MTPTWQTITNDDGDVWLELDVSQSLYVIVRRNEHDYGFFAAYCGFFATVIHSERFIAIDSWTVRDIDTAKSIGEDMLSQYLFDLASEAMTLAGAE